MNEQMTQAQLIPLSMIEMKANVREIDKKDLKDLTASIIKHGLLQPVLVRSVNSHYELIAGHRRYIGYTEAFGEEASIPAIIMETEDSDITILQLTENIQRQDMNPFEESDGYSAVRDKGGCTIRDIALMVGKSPAYVAGRLSLQGLDKSLRKLVLQEKMSLPVALELAKYSHAIQKEVYNSFEHDGYLHKSVKDIVEFVDKKYLRLLDKSIFPKDCPVGVHGACTECHKRSSQEGLLFSKDMVKEDRCLDHECFHYKTKCQIEKVYNDTLTLHKDKCYAAANLGYGEEAVENQKFGKIYNSQLFTTFDSLSKEQKEKHKDQKAYIVIVDANSQYAGEIIEVVRKKLLEVKTGGKSNVTPDERYFRKVELNVKFPMFREVFIAAVRAVMETLPYALPGGIPTSTFVMLVKESLRMMKTQALSDILYENIDNSLSRQAELKKAVYEAVENGDDITLSNLLVLMALTNDLRLSDKESLYRNAQASLEEIKKVVNISEEEKEIAKKYEAVGVELLEKFRKRHDRNPVPPAKKEEIPEPEFTSEEEEDEDLGSIGEDSTEE